MDTIGPDAIAAAAKASPLQAKYGQTVDRESAYETLAAKLAPPPARHPRSAARAHRAHRAADAGSRRRRRSPASSRR